MSHLTSSIAQALKSVEGSMGGAQSTWTTADIGVRVAGRTVIVTGASSGLGLEVARVLALHGATIIMAVRSVAKAQPLKEAIDAELAHSGSKGSVAIAHVDMEDLSSIRAFAAEFAAAHTRLDHSPADPDGLRRPGCHAGGVLRPLRPLRAVGWACPRQTGCNCPRQQPD
eukprot:m.68524 g.68524  ORF g.68524 m.68524 type:complete len:170 (-) comp7502_c0_seq2:226-735(-)